VRGKKVTMWDLETEKEYICDNEFDFKIKQYNRLSYNTLII